MANIAADDQAWLRRTGALPLALAITFCLYWVMQFSVNAPLLGIRYICLTPDLLHNVPQLPQLLPQKLFTISCVIPIEPEMPEAVNFNPLGIADPVIEPDFRFGEGLTALSIPVESNGFDSWSIEFGTGEVIGSAGPHMSPTYPPEAARQGIEGWVEIEYSISKTGRVVNPVVTGQDESGLFAEAALRAVKQWEVPVTIVDGSPVERHGIRTVLTYELDK